MSDYRQGINQKNISAHHGLENDGWTVVEGRPEQAIRIDHGNFEEGPVVGIWRCTQGVIEMEALPYNEFVTVYTGQVVATLDGGEDVELNPGDSFYVPKGSSIRWDVRKTVEKYLLISGSGPVIL